MTKIYKSFDEWYNENVDSIDVFPNDLVIAWKARQPEIDQLKERIKDLETTIVMTRNTLDASLLRPMRQGAKR